MLVHTGLFMSPSEISDPCGTVAGMVTPKGSTSTEGDTPSFCPTLQVLDMCTLGVAADVNPVIKFLRHALQRELDRSVSGQEQVAGCCECGDEPSGSIKCRKSLD
jgi:hypothetical protein